MSPEALPQPPASHALVSGTLRDWVTRTFSGRALAGGAIVKLLAFVLRRFVPGSGIVEAIDTLGDVALVSGAVVVVYRLWTSLKRVALWRVRQKLTLSYIFIGFVPALLIVAFFIVAGLLLFFNVGSYLMRSRIQALADQAHFLAETTTLELQRARSDSEFQEVLERRQLGAASRYPKASYEVLPADRTCETGADQASTLVTQPRTAGPWEHVEPPSALADWVPCGGRAGVLAYTEGEQGRIRLAVRAVVMPEVRRPRFALVVDLPIDDAMAKQLEGETSIKIGTLNAIEGATGDAEPIVGRPRPGSTGPPLSFSIVVGPANVIVGDAARRGDLEWVAFLDYTDWATGNNGTVAARSQMNPLDIYQRISATSFARVGNFTFGQILLLALSVVAGLFLVIQGVAVVMGIALARSITGSVHELFTGTERVRRGDFTHKIAIRSRDQLGALAESFNEMTASIEDLLAQKAEKERLEQELRIARSIQMSLLPHGGIALQGLSLTAHCEPAREVGGDYYDYLPIDDHRIGLLIADVSGKGTSAALYMAVLKGIVLSLSQQHTSPRRLLMDANRIIAQHLDTRSFITVTYAVIDLELRTLTHARAGHCPLIHVPGPHAASRAARVVAPDGLVLGLQIDRGETFDRLLEEETMPLGPGDLVLFYTDGITEAMNPDGDCFGEQRLAVLMQEQAHLPFEELRERILREVHAFAGGAAQHDDMTLLLLRVDA